jgi:hypothetical protein
MKGNKTTNFLLGSKKFLPWKCLTSKKINPVLEIDPNLAKNYSGSGSSQPKMLRIRIRNTVDRKHMYTSWRKWGGGRMCEYMTGGRLNKRIDSWNWNCKKGEGMNSSALVLGTRYRVQYAAARRGRME